MAKPARFLARIKDASAWVTVGERLWRVAKFLGIDGWIAATFWALAAGLLALVVWVVDTAPWYLVLIISIAFATACLHFWNKLRVAWSLRGVRAFDIEQFAKECCDYYREFSDFMVSRQEARPVYQIRGDSNDDMHRRWQESVNFSNRTNAQVMLRFAPRAFAIAHQLDSLGIPPPNMFHFPHGDHGGVGVYIGLVGELLKRGQLEEARKLDPKVTWGSTIY